MTPTHSVLLPIILCTALATGAASVEAATPAGKCQKSRIQMSGKYAACIAGADASFAQAPDTARRDATLLKCESKMQTLWAKKTGKYGDAECGGLWDDVDVRTWLESCNAAMVAGITTNFDIRPTLECIDRNNDGSITAYFGYDNRQADAVTVPAGPNNGISSAGLEAGQPTTFQPGVVTNAFSLRFRGQATWNVGGRSVTANRQSTLCASQPATPTACEADLRAYFLSLEAASDLSVAQLRASYANAIALAEAGLAPLPAPAQAGTQASLRSVADCGTMLNNALASLNQALALAAQNDTNLQNQLLTVLNAVVATVQALPAPRSALTAIVPGTPIPADAFGDFEEWGRSVLADYLNAAALAHVEFAADVLEVAATNGTVLDGEAPGAAPLPFDAASFPRSVLSDDIDASSIQLANSALQALSIADQNTVAAQQQAGVILVSALTGTANAILGGKALYRATLDQARDADRFLLPDPLVEDLPDPTFSAVDPAVAASADAFFQLAQANNRGFRSSLAILGDTQTTLNARILSLVQSSSTPPVAPLVLRLGSLRTAAAPRGVDPDADLAAFIAAFAQTTILQMQNEVVAQSSSYGTNRAALTADIVDWLAQP